MAFLRALCGLLLLSSACAAAPTAQATSSSDLLADERKFASMINATNAAQPTADASKTLADQARGVRGGVLNLTADSERPCSGYGRLTGTGDCVCNAGYLGGNCALDTKIVGAFGRSVEREREREGTESQREREVLRHLG